VKVIGINLDEKKVRHAGPGENVRVKLSGIEEDDIMAGFVLSSIGKYILQEKLICSLYY
jgi:peptide chain release factor subunit 3